VLIILNQINTFCLRLKTQIHRHSGERSESNIKLEELEEEGMQGGNQLFINTEEYEVISL
jgi:hypothetical protein